MDSELKIESLLCSLKINLTDIAPSQMINSALLHALRATRIWVGLFLLDLGRLISLCSLNINKNSVCFENDLSDFDSVRSEKFIQK